VSAYGNESAFNRDWSRWIVETGGGAVLALVGHEMQASGWPDRYVASLTFRGWVEGKRDHRQVTTAQRVVARRLLERGDVYLVLRLLTGETEAESVQVEWVDGTPLLETSLSSFTQAAKPGLLLLEVLATAWSRRPSR
jgi:hypothetical protein